MHRTPTSGTHQTGYFCSVSGSGLCLQSCAERQKKEHSKGSPTEIAESAGAEGNLLLGIERKVHLGAGHEFIDYIKLGLFKNIEFVLAKLVAPKEWWYSGPSENMLSLLPPISCPHLPVFSLKVSCCLVFMKPF